MQRNVGSLLLSKIERLIDFSILNQHVVTRIGTDAFAKLHGHKNIICRIAIRTE